MNRNIFENTEKSKPVAFKQYRLFNCENKAGYLRNERDNK